MRILVVDDEKSVADTLAMILEGEGHEVAAAYDGLDALRKLDSLVPDCVISDVIMPRMNGIEVAIARLDRWRRTYWALGGARWEPDAPWNRRGLSARSS